MRHIEDPVLRSSETPLPRPEKTKSPILKLALAGVAFTLISGYLMSHFFGGERVDSLSDKEKAELTIAFSKVDHINLVPVAAHEVDEALNSMRLEPAAKQQLKAALAKPDTSTASQAAVTAPQKNSAPKLVWLTLWDSMDQDGDAVHVSSAGYEADIALQKAPMKIAVPVDGSALIRVTGLHDGRGGITVGIQQGVSNVLLPVLTPGQVLTLPVTY